MTTEKLNQARVLAEKHPGKASRIILKLVEEIEKLNKVLRRQLRRGTQPVGVLDYWPYHPYLAVPFHEVPEEHLIAWLEQRSRKALQCDIDLGIIAARDLKLYDLITKLSTKPKTPDATGNKDQTLPEEPPSNGEIPAGTLRI